MPLSSGAPQPVGERDLLAIGPILLVILAAVGIAKLWRHFS
ncbi:hypothetical protein [Jiella sp. M17.18]